MLNPGFDTEKELQNKMDWLLLILFFLSLALFFLGVGNRDLWSPDEPRVAEIGREMAETKNFLVPKLNGRVFLEQPPLFYSSLALTSILSGRADDGLSRIPPVIFGFIGVLATSVMASFLFGRSVGLLSGTVLSTSMEYFKISHWIVVDSCLSMFIYLASLSFIKGYLSEEGKKARYYALFFFFATLAFFTKGFIGLGLPLLAVVTFLALERNLKEIWKMRPINGALIFLIPLGLWTYGVYLEGGIDYLKIFYVDNNLLRFLPGGESGHRHPFYFYFKEFPISFAPWIIFLIPAMFLRTRDLEEREKKGILFTKVFFLSGFLVLSLAATKRALYALPIFSACSILSSFLIFKIIENRASGKGERILFMIFLLLLTSVAISIVPYALKASRAYSVTLTRGELTLLLGISLIMLLLLAFSVIFLMRSKVHQSFFFSTLSLIVLLGFLLVWVGPYLNKFKSFKPFVSKVIEYVKDIEKIYAYKPDETLRGFFPFYTGKLIKEIRNVEELLNRARDEKIFIVIRDRRDELARELVEKGFRPVFIERSLAQDRSLALFSN